uniref:type I protein arginine methyltransferase n=1 Tax=Plectus sambesii TaxID=2011161 RepID=A0A914VBC8_9BILA
MYLGVVFVIYLLGLIDAGRCADEFCSKDDELCGRRNVSESLLLQSYAQFAQHRLLLKDHYRVETYRQAILGNLADFKDKVVLDMGAGVGILSLFAAQAGAKIVYAVEPSAIAEHITTLAHANGFGHVIKVINRPIEDMVADELEPVDTIVADPFGYMALHERMIEKVIIARDRFLKPE